MPSVTVSRPVTVPEAVGEVQGSLGDHYRVTPRGHERFSVKGSPVSLANVRVIRDREATTFRVHGGGLIVNRVVNEFGIARKVARAIKDI